MIENIGKLLMIASLALQGMTVTKQRSQENHQIFVSQICQFV